MKWLIFISILLYSCGETSVYIETMACTGLYAPPPVVRVIPDSQWPEDDDENGVYYEIGLVLIKESQSSDDLSSHEYVHHLLNINKGDPDLCHDSKLFLKCSGRSGERCP